MPRKSIKYRICKPVQSKINRKKYSLIQRIIDTALIKINGNSMRQAIAKTKIPHCTLSRIK